MATAVKISKQKLRSGDTLETLRFLRLADSERFDEVFNFWDFSGDPEKELQKLSDMAAKGEDTGGVLKDENKRPFKFSVIDLIPKVRVRHRVVNQSPIRLV